MSERLPFVNGPVDREQVYGCIDNERDYQEAKKEADHGRDHTVEEFLLYISHYTDEARRVASKTWGPACKPLTLDVIRKITALGVACMEANGVVYRPQEQIDALAPPQEDNDDIPF
jgi:hypothetical protein